MLRFKEVLTVKKNPGRKERRRLYFNNLRADSKQKQKANERRQRQKAREVSHAS